MGQTFGTFDLKIIASFPCFQEGTPASLTEIGRKLSVAKILSTRGKH